MRRHFISEECGLGRITSGREQVAIPRNRPPARRVNVSDRASPPNDRRISLGDGLAAIPESLLLAHARGEVLFIVGAGVSRQAGLPDFRHLVKEVYTEVDSGLERILSRTRTDPMTLSTEDRRGLTDPQVSEILRFLSGEYDVVLGMLERRMDMQPQGDSKVRKAIVSVLRKYTHKPAPIHRALMRLSDRGNAVTIATTNFDLLLEAANHKRKEKSQTYSLGSIPRPGLGEDFSGVLHIHGALARNPSRASDLVVTDQDFGEFYLRRRIVPDFIYDAARLFHLVLVGYSAKDPPMRYLLNAVAADGARFKIPNQRYAFYGPDESDQAPIASKEWKVRAAIEDWKSRGIVPIEYNTANAHDALCKSLSRWADLSAINGNLRLIEHEVERIVRKKRNDAGEADRDLFDHLIRRGNSKERKWLASHASKCGADVSWLDAIHVVVSEKVRGRG